jgi:hypothetical protein
MRIGGATCPELPEILVLAAISQGWAIDAMSTVHPPNNTDPAAPTSHADMVLFPS